MNTASFAMYTFSFSVLIQALLVGCVLHLPYLFNNVSYFKHFPGNTMRENRMINTYPMMAD